MRAVLPTTTVVKYTKNILLFIVVIVTVVSAATFILNRIARATPTLLSPNDVVIVTANSDSGWSSTACSDGAPGGPDSNAIDLLLRRDIGSGTVIKVTDNAWTGSALTSSEGIITYTAPTDLPAGTVIRYSDCLYNQGGSGWTRSTPIASFDTAVAGDTLLVYQGTETAPSFIYGFGFRSNSWILSGTPNTNNSRIPAALSSASPTAYMSLGTTNSSRNYQYTAAGNYGIYSSTFLSSLKLASNWSATGGASAGTTFGPTTVPFDATRPTFHDAVRQSPAGALTNSSTVTFRVTTSEPVQALASNHFTVATTGGVTYSSVMAAAVDASTYDVTVTGVAGSGTIALNEFVGAALLDLNGNPASNITFTSESYTVDTIAPQPFAINVDVNSPGTNMEQPIITFATTDGESGIDRYEVSVDGSPFTVQASGYQPTLSATPSHTVTVRAYDMAGNVREQTVTYPPTVSIVAPTTQLNAPITDTTIIVGGPNGMIINTVTITGATGFDCGTLPRAVPFNCTGGVIEETGIVTVIATTDTAVSVENSQSYEVDMIAPTVTVASLTTTERSPALSGTVNDPTATVTVTVNGIAYAALNDGAGGWLLPQGTISPALGAGTYSVAVTAVDTFGNIGTNAAVDELIVTIAAQSNNNTTVPDRGDAPYAPNSGVGASVVSGVVTLVGFLALAVLLGRKLLARL